MCGWCQGGRKGPGYPADGIQDAVIGEYLDYTGKADMWTEMIREVGRWIGKNWNRGMWAKTWMH